MTSGGIKDFLRIHWPNSVQFTLLPCSFTCKTKRTFCRRTGVVHPLRPLPLVTSLRHGHRLKLRSRFVRFWLNNTVILFLYTFQFPVQPLPWATVAYCKARTSVWPARWGTTGRIWCRWTCNGQDGQEILSTSIMWLWIQWMILLCISRHIRSWPPDRARATFTVQWCSHRWRDSFS